MIAPVREDVRQYFWTIKCARSNDCLLDKKTATPYGGICVTEVSMGNASKGRIEVAVVGCSDFLALVLISMSWGGVSTSKKDSSSSTSGLSKQTQDLLADVMQKRGLSIRAMEDVSASLRSK